jgi:hypothetical protein
MLEAPDADRAQLFNERDAENFRSEKDARVNGGSADRLDSMPALSGTSSAGE